MNYKEFEWNSSHNRKMGAAALGAVFLISALTVRYYFQIQARDAQRLVLQREIACDKPTTLEQALDIVSEAEEPGRMAPLEEFIGILSNCASPNGFKSGRIADRLQLLSQGRTFDERVNSLLATPKITKEISIALLRKDVNSDVDSTQLTLALLQKTNEFGKPPFVVLSALASPAYAKLEKQAQGELRSNLAMVADARTRTDLLGALKASQSLVPTLRTILGLQRLNGQDRERIETQLGAVSQIEAALAGSLTVKGERVLSGLEMHQVLVSHRFSRPDGEPVYQSVLMDQTEKGYVVIWNPTKDDLPIGYPANLWLYRGEPSSVDVVFQDGKRANAPQYFVFPTASIQKSWGAIQATAQSAALFLNTPQETSDAASSSGSPAAAAENQPGDSGAVKLAENSELKVRAGQAFKVLEENNSIADIADADNTDLVRALSSPKDAADWRHLKALDERFSESDDCSEAGCLALSMTMRRAIVQAESIMKMNGPKPPPEVGFEYRVLRQSGK